MAYFALLWKARTIQKYKNDYEIEKLNTIVLSEERVEDAFSSQKLWHCRRRFHGVLLKLFPEGSSVHTLIKYLKTDQTFPNFVLKSVIGFVGGVVLTYLCFLFFVFQLSISLIHATVMSSILGIFLTLGLAFSYRVRCLVFLVIPQFFSRIGRYTLTCYALVLILTGPATNALRNSEALSECMANGQEQVKTMVLDLNESVKNPYYAFKDNIDILIARGKQTADKVTDLVLKIHRLALSIVSVVHLSFGWLSSITRSCNKKLPPPYEHCANALKVASLDCQAKYEPWKHWMCDVSNVTKQACKPKASLKTFCMKIDYVNAGLKNNLKKKLRAFFNRVKNMLLLEVKVHRSYVMSSTVKPLNQSGSSGIVTEIRHRANPLLTWLSWSSYLTSASALIILFRAKYYQYMYETRSRYDNRYITKEFRQLDLKRSRQVRETVLPLNRREKGKYIKPTSFRLLEAEKVSLSRSIVFMVATTFKLMIHIVADFSLYWILKIIRHHGKRQTPLILQSPSKILVRGSKPAASILRSMIDSVSPDFMSFSPNLMVTLPDPFPPDFERYGQIGILICLLWFFALFEPYGLRLRHFVMGLYRPERAEARAKWLYHHILRTRAGFMKYARRKLHREYKYTSEAKYTFRNWLHSHVPFRWFILESVGRKCLLCNITEHFLDADSTLVRCKSPDCPGTYCTRCFSDIGQLCTICMRPADYGDMSDVSLEIGSSAESSDSDNGSLRSGRNKLAQFILNKKKQSKKYLKKEKKAKKETQEEMSLLKFHSQKTGCNQEKSYRNKANRVRHMKHLTENLEKKNIGNFQIYCQDCNDYAKECNRYFNESKSCRLVHDRDKKSHHKSYTTSSTCTGRKSKKIAKYFIEKLTYYSPSRNFKRKIKHKRESSIQNIGLSEISSCLVKRRRQNYLHKVRKKTRRKQKLQYLKGKVSNILQRSASAISNSLYSNFSDKIMTRQLRRRGKRYIKVKLLGKKIEFLITNHKSNVRLGDYVCSERQTPTGNPDNTHNKNTRPQKNSLNASEKSNANLQQDGTTGRKTCIGYIKNPTDPSDEKVNESVDTKDFDFEKNVTNKGQIKNACSPNKNYTFKKFKKSKDKTPKEATLANYKRRKKIDKNNINQALQSKIMRDLKIESFFAGHEWFSELVDTDHKFDTAVNLQEVEKIRQNLATKETEEEKDNTRQRTYRYAHCPKAEPTNYGDAVKAYNVCCERQGSPARGLQTEDEEGMVQKCRKKWYHYLPFFNLFISLFTCRLCINYRKQKQMKQMEMREMVNRHRTRQSYQSCVSPQIDRKPKNINVAVERNRSSLNICQGHVEIDATVPTCTCAIQYVGNDHKLGKLQTKDAATLHFNAEKMGLKTKDLSLNCLKRSDTTGTQYYRQKNKTSVVKFEENPTCINFEDPSPCTKFEDPPSRIQFEEPPTQMEFENRPNLKNKDPTNLKIKNSLTGIKIEDPPTQPRTKFIDPPNRIKCEDPPNRINYEDPPNADIKASTNSRRISNHTPTVNKSDTAVYKNQHSSKFTPEQIYKKRRNKTVHQEDKSTITDSVCNASTITSDWWSPMEEWKDKAPLERKKGTYLMSERKRYLKKIKNRGVWTEEKKVKFKSNTQIIPQDWNSGSDSKIAAAGDELITPLRYLLESQKYYNELYTPWFNTPLSVMSLQRAEQNLLTRGVASEDNLSLICNYGSCQINL